MKQESERKLEPVKVLGHEDIAPDFFAPIYDFFDKLGVPSPSHPSPPQPRTSPVTSEQASTETSFSEKKNIFYSKSIQRI